MGDMADIFNSRDFEEMNEPYDDYYDRYYNGDPSETLIGITILHTTDDAVLIQHKNRQSWFPKSVVVIDKDTITYPLWCSPNWLTIAKRLGPIDGDFV